MSARSFNAMAPGKAIAMAVVLLAAANGSAWAQAEHGSAYSGAAKGSIPRLPDGKPDFSGVWQHPYVPDMTKNTPSQTGMAELPYTTAGLAAWKAYDAAGYDYTGHCMPQGLTRSMNSPFPIQLVSTPGQLVILTEFNQTYHVVPTDGRTHPTDLVPQWAGLSVGHWEGDTLVVDTRQFNGKTKLDTIGHPMSDQLHVIQRFTRTDPTHIAYEMTIDDPPMYAKPWKNSRVFTLRPDWELLEYSCEENNKDINEGHIK